MIGVFDSGFGGLTVLSAFLDRLPQYDYLYLGDTARAPYGNHSKETILDYTREGVEFLFSQGASLVILACNTASSNALRELQEELIRKPGVKDKNILGVVIPIAEEVGRLKKTELALIGTRATVDSGVYQKEIEKHLKGFHLEQAACPLLVPLIEEGWAQSMETKRILKDYLRPLKFRNPELLIPACTHYPILQKEMQRVMGKKTLVLKTGEVVAKSLEDYLKRHPEMEKRLEKKGSRKFMSTDDAEKFKEISRHFFKHPLTEVQRIHLPA